MGGGLLAFRLTRTAVRDHETQALFEALRAGGASPGLARVRAEQWGEVELPLERRLRLLRAGFAPDEAELPEAVAIPDQDLDAMAVVYRDPQLKRAWRTRSVV